MVLALVLSLATAAPNGRKSWPMVWSINTLCVDPECGTLACGFFRARCPADGRDFRVGFSCKGRGVCPSYNARRMVETAAHLVDHIFPPLPVWQRS